MRKQKQSGFSLLELVIVVAIILIISAIAIPRLLQAMNTSKEAAGAASLRSMNTALAAYQSKWSGFPAAAGSLGGTCNTTTPPSAINACDLDSKVAASIGTAPVGAYDYTYTQTATGAGFTLLADPHAGSGAIRHYYTDESFTIHFNDTQAAASTDNTL